MKHLPSRNALLGGLGATAALSALVAVALARGGGGSNAPSPNPATTTPPNPAPAGMVVAKDAETGALRMPTAEEMADLQPKSPAAQGKNGAEAPLKTQQLANGTVVTTLNPSYDVYSVASKATDGKIQRACVPGDKIEAALETAADGALTPKQTLDEK